MTTVDIEKILACVPQQAPFRFIDEITEIDEDHVVGSYTYKTDEFFYKGHFPEMPVTPGVILTETMAQIGLVTLGALLNGGEPEALQNTKVLFTSADVKFLRMVLPGEKVIVRSKKMYYKLRKLCCEVVMVTPDDQIIASGTLSGMFIRATNN